MIRRAAAAVALMLVLALPAVPAWLAAHDVGADDCQPTTGAGPDRYAYGWEPC